MSGGYFRACMWFHYFLVLEKAISERGSTDITVRVCRVSSMACSRLQVIIGVVSCERVPKRKATGYLVVYGTGQPYLCFFPGFGIEILVTFHTE